MLSFNFVLNTKINALIGLITWFLYAIMWTDASFRLLSSCDPEIQSRPSSMTFHLFKFTSRKQIGERYENCILQTAAPVETCCHSCLWGFWNIQKRLVLNATIQNFHWFGRHWFRARVRTKQRTKSMWWTPHRNSRLCYHQFGIKKVKHWWWHKWWSCPLYLE